MSIIIHAIRIMENAKDEVFVINPIMAVQKRVIIGIKNPSGAEGIISITDSNQNEYVVFCKKESCDLPNTVLLPQTFETTEGIREFHAAVLPMNFKIGATNVVSSKATVVYSTS